MKELQRPEAVSWTCPQASSMLAAVGFDSEDRASRVAIGAGSIDDVRPAEPGCGQGNAVANLLSLAAALLRDEAERAGSLRPDQEDGPRG